MSAQATVPAPPVSEFERETTPGQGGIGEAAGGYWERIKGGDLGALPAVIGALVLVIVFGIMEPDSFLTQQNFANLLNQGAAIMVLAMGLVFVLLLGEIDLSAGFTAGTGAAILGVTLTNHGWAWPLAVAAALLTGVAIGFAIALLVARLGIPSFVVSLAFFLGLQGAMLLIIGEGGTIPIRDDAVLSVMNKNMPTGLGWLFAVIVVAGFAATSLRAIQTRKRAGLQTPAMSVWAAKVGALAVVVLIAVFLLNQERQRANAPIIIQGVPWVVPLVVALVVALTFLLMRTSFGRHVYAVGGNAEAARRAGINVPNIKTVCFILGSTLAIVAGILLASRDNSVSPTTGGAQTLLYAVGAAVIGGTSLFGGRGRIVDAVTGGLVVAIIANGLPLVTQKSGVQFIINGLVLLLAASVDAVSRRRAAATGR
ncbi:sugar ABC transporter permease [Solirubrobacter phytolaccae]|uniref:Xylose transport system permease protein XylH n=1 Tax=Solirubrobacter phytolaccae TaxID=1404360 RepID=A0A9X3N4T6_9ACTN|nr:sugar ABC transporter permease [Solirubrobacter phytolaccae]MDA0179654.1 sugar ABC transporter permease [Solirubrobacter phytolaccae]